MRDDFSELYAQLGIRSDCDVDAFKRACRRCIGRQHPDRVDPSRDAGRTQMPLDEVLRLYAQALRFHRVHGRLPGAVPLGPTDGFSGLGVTQGRPCHKAATTPAAFPPAADDDRQGSPRVALLLLGTAIAAILLIIGLQNDDSTAVAPRSQALRPAMEAIDASTTADRLEIGMDTATVLAIQGEPMQRDGAEWLYGPSWLRFDGEHLVDWYSSPLHALKTQGQSPPAEVEDSAL